VSKTLTIGDNAIVFAQSGVPYSLEANKIYFGSPAEEVHQKKAGGSDAYPNYGRR
jgi:UDP-3-O-[3-hydroxymyristoyl] glucosamine N-acyltransferase